MWAVVPPHLPEEEIDGVEDEWNLLGQAAPASHGMMETSKLSAPSSADDRRWIRRLIRVDSPNHPRLLPLGKRGIIKSEKRVSPAKVQLFFSARINR